MLRTAIRNLLAHKLRLLLSGAAVVLGVAFISGTLTFTDALSRTFTDLFEDTAADVNIEPKAAFETGLVGTGISSSVATVPETVVDQVSDLEGVEAVEGYVQAEGVYVLDRDGDILNTGGAPGIGTSWSDEESLSPATMTAGRAPATEGEVALDTGTADKTGYDVGDRITLLTTGPRLEVDVVGIFRFGEDGGLAGASLVAFDLDTAQRLLLKPGHYTGVSVSAADGVADEELAARITDVVGSGYDVKTRAEQASDGAAAMESELEFVNQFLLVFAGVALFVGSFLILNTFSMLVAQRTRELALVRALGASRRQITASVLVEAFLLGVVGATTGLVVGYGLAHVLEALFGRIGLTLDAALTLTPGTIAWSYLVGVVVTLVAAYLPARRAARVPPVAAMRADLVSRPRSLRGRALGGSLLVAVGLAGLLAGVLPEDGSGVALAVGAACLLIAFIAISPVLAVPFIRAVGAVLPRLAGRTGHLARENAVRNPRRTAATSSALMVGLALVTGFSIIGASARASVDQLIDDVLVAEYVVSTAVGQPFTPQLADELRAVDGVASVTQARFGTARIGEEVSTFTAYDPASLSVALDVELSEGSLDAFADDGLLMEGKVAQERGLAVGDELLFTLPNGQERTLRLVGLISNPQVVGSFVVSMGTYVATGGADVDRIVYVVAKDGRAGEALESALEDVVAAYPVVDLKDAAEFKEEQRGQVDQMLMLINALLVLSIVIAALGVVNTLVLSVMERTRELGLLRALGMSRRQVRRLVRLESVLISCFGAALGLALGAALGLAATGALEEEGLTAQAVPGLQLVLFLVLGAVTGVIAAALPARRAGRLKVLEAIATE